MLDLLTRWTWLPNAHPLLVHFPIALLPVALGLELAGLWRGPSHWAGRAAVLLTVLACLGVGLAYLSGEDAAEHLAVADPAAQAHLAEHESAAEWALRLALLTLALRLAAAWRDRRPAAAGNLALRAVATVLLAVLLGVAAWTADRGGRLVYQDGLAVRPAARTPPPAASGPDRPDGARP
jgi:uncharacterized membrane protein